jgi:hypothetical protein
MDASQQGRFLWPGSSELELSQVLFERTLANPDDPQLPAAWAELGLALKTIQGDSGSIWILEEAPNRKEGRGFYAFRKDARSGVLLQMPHSFKDHGTREIGLHLFLEGDIQAAAWNVVPRYYNEGSIRVDADLAKLPETHFIALSLAFVRHRPSGVVIQLHGFDQGKRTGAEGGTADYILSSGRKEPTSALLRWSELLKSSLTGTVRLFPQEVDELGGTTNIVGKSLRKAGFREFVHIEMSEWARSRMMTDASLRASFLKGFGIHVH